MRIRELLALILALVMAMPAAAQAPAPAQVPVVVASNAGGMAVEDLRVTVSKSLVIDYPADISRISTSNPEIVDAVPATSREFLLHGKGHGSATVVVWAKNGLRTMYNVTVEHNLDPIKRMLKETFPGENIGVVAGRDSITLIGTVSNKEVADRAVAIATPLAKTVVSNLALVIAPVSKQIILKVRFAELDRTAAQQFGVNLVSTGAGGTTGGITTQQFSPPSVNPENKLSISDALNIFAFRKDLNLAAFVKALQAQGTLQILAEPNLVTTNGKEASFLVGGEFPVPVLQGGSNAGAVTIQFREFGIRLLFNPVITENNTIKLYVKPEVSTIDLANAVTFSGFTIPALATRRMETNIELGFGQSFVIAGLIDDRVTEQFNKLPGLANIPILGALFRSRTENRSKSELVIIVTPEVATPINAGDPKPEPAWLRQFMPQKQPGDKVGTDLVPGPGGAVLPPMLPGRTQVNYESVGNGNKAHPVTPRRDPKPKAEAKPKSDGKGEADSGKRNPLKLWGRKPTKPDQKSENFRMIPAGERALAPSVESAPRQVTETSSQVPLAPRSPYLSAAPEQNREANPAEVRTAETPAASPTASPSPSPVAQPVTQPQMPVVAPVLAPSTPIEAASNPELKAVQTANLVAPATAHPAQEPANPAREPDGKGEAKPTEDKEGKSPEPGSLGQQAVAFMPARRSLSAGITSLPPQVLTGSPNHALSAPAATAVATRRPNAGEPK